MMRMSPFCLVPFFSSFLLQLTLLKAQSFDQFRYSYCFNNNGNYTNTSTYSTNLKTLLSNLTSDTRIDYGFYNFSYGQSPERASAIGLCRGDVKPETCRNCLNNASTRLTNECQNQIEAMGGYDECMLRYSNRSIFGVYDIDESWFSMYLWNVNNATDVDEYNQVVSNLLNNLTNKASGGDWRRKFAAGNETGPNFQRIFAAVQCTPDLSQQVCSDCLVKAISEIPNCCSQKRGGRVIKLSCNIRYENERFYDPSAEDSSAPSVPPPSTSPQGNNNNSRTIIVIVVPIVVFVLLVLLIIFIYFRVKKGKKNTDEKGEAEIDDEMKPTATLHFDFETIRVATDDFSDANKLGQGGFGSVYKGILNDGQEVAVKRLAMNSGQGDIEFKNEVTLLVKLQHRNLVRLLGFCLERRERLLIYEFLPNKSLDYFLFDPNRQALLNWQIRYKIIEGITRGLLYLHEDSQLRIIHRDLKVSNILLDEEFNPKVSDFGMARLFSVDQTQSNTSRIVGTYGYMSPEYAMHGQYSIKSDVFSFGVLILEIISGKKNTSIFHGENMQDLITFAWMNWRENTAFNIVDPVLRNSSRNQIMRCIHIGLLCVQENVADRPTMSAILLMLSSNTFSLPLPSQPPFVSNSTSSSHMQLREYSSEVTISSEREANKVEASRNEASITELFPR